VLSGEKGAGGGEGFAGSSPPGCPPYIRSSSSKTLKAKLQTTSSVSVPTFLTMGFQILSLIQAGAPLGLSTCTLSPASLRSFSVPPHPYRPRSSGPASMSASSGHLRPPLDRKRRQPNGPSGVRASRPSSSTRFPPAAPPSRIPAVPNCPFWIICPWQNDQYYRNSIT